MGKINFRVALLLVLSFQMAGIRAVASDSIGNIGSEIILETEPKSADPYTLHIGAWIIVAGDRESDHNLYYTFETGCNSVYDSLISIGVTSDNIYYLAGDWDGSLPPNADNVSTQDGLEYAITTWAQDKVSATNGLGIYLFDHGGIGVMGIPGPNLGGFHLDNYLNTLESATGMTRSVIIYEACHSGSFISNLSEEGRIIITSTDIDHNAYVNPDLTHCIFSEHFWAAVTMGYRLGYCFEYATECVNIWGYGNYQKPLIEDNHDYVGHEVNINTGELPNWGDGWDAKDITLGEPLLTLNTVNIMKCSLKKYLPTAQEEMPLWVVAENNTDIEYIRARVFPERWEVPEPGVDEDGISYFNETDFSEILSFDLIPDPASGENGEKNYSTSIEMLRYPDIFGGGNGDYKILYEAKALDGLTAKPLTTTVTRNDDGEAPTDLIPPTVIIKNPWSNLEISDEVNITVKGDDDQALAKIQILLDGELLNEMEMPAYYPYPEAVYNLDTTKHVNGIHNITAVAIDESGNMAQTSVFVNFENSRILNFDYQPYFIGAGIGVALSLVGSLVFKRKKKK